MKKLFLVLALTAIYSATYSQAITRFGNITDINGRIIQETKYTSIEGTPYLNTEWVKGEILRHDNVRFVDIRIKYDAYTDKLEYLFENKPFVLETPIKEFRIFNNDKIRVFKSGFTEIDNNTQTSLYEVLNNSKISYLKKYRAKMHDYNMYNSATVHKRFIMEEMLYLSFEDGKMVKIKRDKKSMLDAFSDKTAEIDKFIKDNNIKFRSDDDIAAIIDYYVSITTRS